MHRKIFRYNSVLLRITKMSLYNYFAKKTPSRTTVKVAGTAGKLTFVEEEVQNALENVSKPNSTNEKG